MGSYCTCIGSHSNPLLLLLSLLLLCSAQARSFGEGRPIVEHLQATREEADGKLMTRAMIGSRPPRCERMCAACGHCKAVQVPAVPQDRNRAWHLPTRINSRGDDSSNYKPVSWKCKCGDIIMNP